MSAICGIYSLDLSPASRNLIERMTEYQGYRAPDGHNIWVHRHAGFGASLLRTNNNLNESAQSIFDGYTIVADVRMDGRLDLIKKLKANGQSISSETSDAELILHAYRIWSEECVDHLFGDFAFVIWDNRKETVFGARDHFGIKPFYYAVTQGQFLFSNTMDCLFLSPHIDTKLNEQAVADYLLFGLNADAHSTIYTDIKRLPPAHSIRCDPKGLKLKQYWSKPPATSIRYRNRKDYVENFRQIFFEAVRDRITNNHILLSLSGGMDSTSVAAAAQQILSNKEDSKLRAITISAWTAYHPEFQYAKLVADHLHIPIEFIFIDDLSLYQGWETCHMASPFPSDNPLAYVSALFLEEAGDARVSLGGSGGDALLAWPKNHFLDLARERKLLGMVREIATYLLQYRKIPPLRFRSTLKRRLGWLKADAVPPLPGWLSPEFVSRCNLMDRWKSWHLTQASLLLQSHGPAFWLQNPVWPNYFEEQDPGSTHYLMESRHPFFDMRLLNYISSIPSVPWLIDKNILRTAMKEMLPGEILSRPKTLVLSDRVAALVQSGKGDHLKSLSLGKELECFIDRNQASHFDQTDGDEYQTYVNLRPFNLAFWLKNRNDLLRSLKS